MTIPEETKTEQTEEQKKPGSAAEKKKERDSSQFWISFLLILFHLCLAIVILWGVYWLVERHEYRAEHIIAVSDGDPVQICYAPDDNATKASAQYIACAIRQKLGTETELVTETDEDAWNIRILCGVDLPDEQDAGRTLFGPLPTAANAGEEDEYSVYITENRVTILVSEQELCFGAVKAVVDRWFQEDCGLKEDGSLHISRNMIDRQLAGLQTEITGQFRILSQNLRNRDDEDGNTVSERAERFFQLVDDYQPDLIGTQEATSKWMQLLENRLSNHYGLLGCSRKGPNADSGERNAILYRKDRFTFLQGDTFWLSNTPSVVSKLNYDGAVRICTWALLQDNETGKTLLFSNTHLQNQIGSSTFYRDVRARQAEIILFKLRGNGNMISTYPGFLTGDFNGDPSEPFYSAVTSVYDDAHTTAISDFSSVAYSFHGYGQTEELLDFCFHSPENVTILDYRILDDKYDGYVSDHYGILVTALVN